MHKNGHQIPPLLVNFHTHYTSRLLVDLKVSSQKQPCSHVVAASVVMSRTSRWKGRRGHHMTSKHWSLGRLLGINKSPSSEDIIYSVARWSNHARSRDRLMVKQSLRSLKNRCLLQNVSAAGVLVWSLLHQCRQLTKRTKMMDGTLRKILIWVGIAKKNTKNVCLFVLYI